MMIKAIIFSNNSPKALNTFLQSAKTHAINLFEFNVLYKSEDNNELEYLKIIEKYEVSSKKEINFKENILELIGKTDGLVAFFKDTNYFFAGLPESNIEEILLNEDVFCFALSLGRNIKYCFHNEANNVLLNENENKDGTIFWDWTKHYLDYGRPLELGGGHIFHKKEIYKLFNKWNYNSIKELEDSFDKLDYYPKESMASFKNSILVDVILKEDSSEEMIKVFDFKNLDRKIIEI